VLLVPVAAAPVGVPEPVAAGSGRSDFERATRVTPWTVRRRDIRTATCRWPVVQPASEIAGALMSVRSGSLVAPLLAAPESPDSEPVIELSVTSAGIAREMSRSACSQSKRALARSLTVCRRCSVVAAKSAYGFSRVAFCVSAADCALTWSSLAWRSLMVLLVSTYAASATTQNASTPRTAKAPVRPAASSPEATTADAGLPAPRRSGGRRLTAFITLCYRHPGDAT
jgi:hypothetical protein